MIEHILILYLQIDHELDMYLSFKQDIIWHSL